MPDLNPVAVGKNRHQMKKTCEICGKSVAASYYIPHLKNHDKMYACRICPDRQFRFKKDFHRHTRAHKMTRLSAKNLEKVGDFEVRAALGRKALVYTAPLDHEVHDNNTNPIINNQYLNQMKEIISSALDKWDRIRLMITFNILYSPDSDTNSEILPPVSGALSSKFFLLNGESDVENSLVDAINLACNSSNNNNASSNLATSGVTCVTRSLISRVKDVELKITKYVPHGGKSSSATILASLNYA